MRKSIVPIYVYTYIYVIIYMYTITIMYIDVYISIIAIYVGNIHEHTILLNKVLSWWQCVGLYKPVLQWFPGAACFPVGQPDASRWAFQLCFVLATHKNMAIPRKHHKKSAVSWLQFKVSPILLGKPSNQTLTFAKHSPRKSPNHPISLQPPACNIWTDLHHRNQSAALAMGDFWGFSGRTKAPTVPHL